MWKGRAVVDGARLRRLDGAEPTDRGDAVKPVSARGVRCLLAVAVATGQEPIVADVRSAYLQAQLGGTDPVYVFSEDLPPLPGGGGGRAHYLLRKAVYGLPRSGGDWAKLCCQTLCNAGFVQATSEPDVFLRGHKSSARTTAIGTYVDDMLAVGKNAKQTLEGIGAELPFGADPDGIKQFLGARYAVTDNNKTLTTSMEDYADLLVKRFVDETGVTPALRDTPLAHGVSLDDVVPDAHSPGKYAGSASRHLAGILFLARLARPDLSYATTRLMSRVAPGRWNDGCDAALVNVFGYIRKTSRTAKLVWHGGTLAVGFDLITYTDASFGSEFGNRSMSGCVTQLVSVADQGQDEPMGLTVDWFARRQGHVSTSTAEAELFALMAGHSESLCPVRELLSECGLVPRRCILRTDASAVFAAIMSPIVGHAAGVLASGRRQQRVTLARLREDVMGNGIGGAGVGTVELQLVRTTGQLADLFTKALARHEHQAQVARLGLVM